MSKKNIFCYIIISVVVAVSVFAFGGCGKKSEVEQSLERVESEVMDVHPDSALKILESIAAEDLTDDRLHALHSLLLAQARHKNYIDQTDDRYVSSACHYFSDHGDDRRAMKAFFYRAVIQEESADYAHAIVSAMISEEYAEELNDIYFLAKINELYSDIYNETFNVEQELKHVKLAAELYNKAGYHTNYVCSMIDYARALNNNNEYERCIELLDSISPMCQKEDSAIIAYHISSYLSPCISLRNYEKASKKFADLKLYIDCFEFSNIDYENAYIIESYRRNQDEANYYLDKLFERSRLVADAPIQMALYKYYKSIDSLENAINHLEKCFEIQNEKTEKILRQSTSIAQRDYLRTKSRIEKHRSDRLIYWGIVSFIVTLLIIAFSIIYYKYKLKLRTLEIERKLREIQALYSNLNEKDTKLDTLMIHAKNQEEGLNSLSCELANKTEELQRLNLIVESLFKERFSIMNKLCEEYFIVHNSNKERQIIYNKVEQTIKDLKSPSSLKEIESTVNELRDGIMARLDKQFPNLKSVDRTFLLLTYAGLPTRTICTICEITIGNYYNKRQRLKARFEASDAPDAHMFIKYMDN